MIFSYHFLIRANKTNKECPKINARFEFAAICAVKCWQPKKNNLTADSLGLVKMERENGLLNINKWNSDFSSKIILSDEAHFHLDGFVNRQNRPLDRVI